MRRLLATALGSALFLVGCAGDGAPEGAGTAASVTSTSTSTSADAAEQRFPDVERAQLQRQGDAWSLSVTISSPYDTPERYADGWRVLTPDGGVLGTHELAHDHANEQPFTRSMTGLEIPGDVEQVTVEGRDLEHGYGGSTVTIDVPG